MPDPNVDHQRIVGRLTIAFSAAIDLPAGGEVFPGLNLSDRTVDWMQNYRCPDVGVFLAGNKAQVFEAHICGPADFLVEIVSPGDKSRDKFDFYAALGVRELLLIDRYPWSLELYRLSGNELVLAGRSTDEQSDLCPERRSAAQLPACAGRAAAGNSHCGNRWRAKLDRVRRGKP